MPIHAAKRTGQIFVISAPSGTGKTTLVSALLQLQLGLQLSISYTTRPRRSGEEDGVHYHFVSKEQFEQQIQCDLLLEYTNLFGHYYGTSKAWIKAQLAEGGDVLLEIDWQGAEQVRGRFPLDQQTSIFILPPQLQTLRERLEARGKDATAVIEERFQKASSELRHALDYDYLVLNDSFETALSDLKHIILAERLKRARQRDCLAPLLGELGVL